MVRDKKVLEDIAKDAHGDVDFFRDFIYHLNKDARVIMQSYMMYKFKYILGEELKEDPGWDRATMEFCDRGYASRFADVYKEGLTVAAMEKLMFRDWKPKER
jgi:hypothetical protein